MRQIQLSLALANLIYSLVVHHFDPLSGLSPARNSPDVGNHPFSRVVVMVLIVIFRLLFCRPSFPLAPPPLLFYRNKFVLCFPGLCMPRRIPGVVEPGESLP